MLFWDRLRGVCFCHHLPRRIVFLPGFLGWGPSNEEKAQRSEAWLGANTESQVQSLISAIFPGLCPLSYYRPSHLWLSQSNPASPVQHWTCFIMGVLSALLELQFTRVVLIAMFAVLQQYAAEHRWDLKRKGGWTGVFSWAQVWVALHVTVACCWITCVGETCPTWTDAPGKACVC